VSKVAMKMTYRDKATREEEIQHGQDGQDGVGESLDQMEDLLRSLVDPTGTVSE